MAVNVKPTIESPADRSMDMKVMKPQAFVELVTLDKQPFQKAVHSSNQERSSNRMKVISLLCVGWTFGIDDARRPQTFEPAEIAEGVGTIHQGIWVCNCFPWRLKRDPSTTRLKWIALLYQKRRFARSLFQNRQRKSDLYHSE